MPYVFWPLLILIWDVHHLVESGPFQTFERLQTFGNLIFVLFLPLRGGGQAFFRVIISFGLGPPEVAPYMTGTFGEVFGPRNHTGSEPRPARK